MSKRYTYQDNFEMLILRHDYLKRVENVDPNWINEFEPIVKTTAGIMYDKLKPNFAKVGYDLDDVVTITNCYMIAYMALYSLRRNNDARRRINASYKRRFDREPTPFEIAKKERINMMSFLRQRLQHASVLCARKARNITVDYDKRATFALTANAQPASHDVIFEKGEKLGYRRVTKAELKEIKKVAKKNRSAELMDEFGYPVIEIEMLNDGISENDYRNLFISDKNDAYHQSPEQSFLEAEKEVDMANIIDEFSNMTPVEKKSCLRDFIGLYKGNKKYSTELTAARKMLKSL